MALSLSMSRPVELLLCLALVVLSLRPIGVVERAFEHSLVPTRGLAELASPLRLVLDGRGVVAAAAPQERVREVYEQLESSIRASALPSRVTTAHGFHGEVVGRERGAIDRLRVRVLEVDSVRVGQPVVFGDWFVGLVSRVPTRSELGDARADLARDEVVVDLITGRNDRIGAIVTDAAGEVTSRLVVGGIAARDDGVFLDVHSPSNRRVRAGRVEVWEPRELAEGDSDLANGFLLGQLVHREVGGRGVLAIAPGIDFANGLYQLMILTSDTGVAAGSGLPRILDDPFWLPAPVLLRAETAAHREGFKLAVGARAGVRPGAAVARGGRLVGRILRVHAYGADVAQLGDPGGTFAALAGVPTARGMRTHVMGRVRALGREASGDLVFEWAATVPLEDGLLGGSSDETIIPAGTTRLPAMIWTGSGEPGVPRGLLVGEAYLPLGTGPHRIVIRQAEDARETAGLRVRLEESTEWATLEGGGT